MNLPLAGVVIVTGTDTDAGKTVVTAALARTARERGTDLVAIKPTQTGLQPGEEGDVQLVGRLAGIPADRCLEGVRLPEPLAPTTAGRRAGIALPSMREQAAAIAARAAVHELVLVEGAGGILVGLDGDGGGLLELADALTEAGVRPAFVVVTRAGLGTLNHTRLTVDAILRRGHRVAGMIIGSWPRDPDLATRCNREEIQAFCQVPLLGGVAEHAGTGPDTLAGAWREPSELR